MVLILAPTVQKVLKGLVKVDRRRFERVRSALDKLAVDPRDPALSNHPVRGAGAVTEWGAKQWIAYVETRTPAAWRMVWAYGPSEGEITVTWIGPLY